MKRLILLATLLAGITASAQMKKPVIMVVPADVWCNDNGYMATFNDMGTSMLVPDYKLALQTNGEIRSAIGSIGNIMADYGFPLKNLEAELRRMQNEEAELSVTMSKDSYEMVAENPVDRLRRSAKCDILIDVSYRRIQNGPFSKVVFNITALDAYSSMEVAACPPVETEAVDAPIEILLDRAVQDVKATFATKIQNYFEDTYTKGRNARILLRRWDDCPMDFESEVVYADTEAELGEVIQVWFNDHCVGGQYNLANATDNVLEFNPARIPVRGLNLAGKEVPIDAAGFVRPLAKWLKSQYGLDSKVVPKGLGEVWLILGGK
ncbi:MAG: hypothetical protein J5669_03345 [Bacteroidales bacterium]|nr:hypothetical protein [Bacteroidales bacterium]